MAKLTNKGERSYRIGEQVLAPGGTIEVEQKQAERLAAIYSSELSIEGERAQAEAPAAEPEAEQAPVSGKGKRK